MVMEERDEVLLLSMRNSNRGIDDQPTAVKAGDEAPPPSRYPADQHFSRSSHAGLSALLSAVTLQLSESNEDEHEKTSSLKENLNISPTLDQVEDSTDQQHSTNTPTIVSERPSSTTVTPLPRTFPQQLMTLLMDSDKSNMITWLPDGKYFALRNNELSMPVLKERFGLDSIESFLTELASWGFALIETRRAGIAVFRNKLFREGDWERCDSMHRCDPAAKDENDPDNGIPGKRTLSPGHRQMSEDSDESSRKIRLQDSSGSDLGDDYEVIRRRCTLSDEHRSLASSITTEKLQIRQTAETEEEETAPLMQQAMAGATHTIVTDAIETLLHDREHTQKCFAIHAEELSKSTIPGLVPISKQLFSTPESEAQGKHTKQTKAIPLDPSCATRDGPLLGEASGDNAPA
jgi:HSF-type DNA-binding